MRSIIFSRSSLSLLALIGVLLLGVPKLASAQAPLGEGQGTATIEGWPRSLVELLDEMGKQAPYLLPRIDSLALDYRYAVTDSTSRWSFVLSWRPAERVLYEGEVLPRREAPRDLHMTNVEFRATVRVDGDKRAEMIIGVDSMALRPSPDRFAFNVTVRHERVFLDTSPEEARRILSEGVTLDPLVVERMGFASAETQRRGRPPDTRRRDTPPQEPSIYSPRTRILIGWRVAPRPYYVGDGEGDEDTRTERPRGETVGRSPSGGEGRARGVDRGADGESDDAEEGGDGEGRSRRGETESSDDEEDDEEDVNLQAPALAAVAAVGLVAFAGGTVGLYGRGGTPIGLASGYTHPKGGVQLQASVNRAVLEDEAGQKLSLRALGFYDVFGARVQPAVGLGVQIDPGEETDVEPALSGGLVGNFGRIVVYGGFDVVQQTPEIGVAYNFRSGTGDESN